jgi:hypothetical protein
MNEFKTLATYKGDMVMLTDVSYNKACYYLDNKLAENNDKIINCMVDKNDLNRILILSQKHRNFLYYEDVGILVEEM